MQQQSPDHQRPPPRRGPLLGLLLIFVVILVALSLAHLLGGAARLQDCVLSGRSDCGSSPRGSSGD